MSNVVRMYEFVALKRQREAKKKDDERMNRIIENAKAIREERVSIDVERGLHRNKSGKIELLDQMLREATKGDKDVRD